MNNYSVWYAHGELHSIREVGQCSNPSNPETTQDIDDDVGDRPRYEQMVIESMHQHEVPYYEPTPQDPNERAQTFYNMVKQASEPLWDGCKKASTLSTTTRLLNWKAENNISDSAFDRLVPIIKDSLPTGEKLPNNFYETKKMLKPLQLPSQRIHHVQR